MRKDPALLGVTVSFFVVDKHAPAWIAAALRELRRQGHRFPNLSARAVPAAQTPWLRHWEDLAGDDRPEFAATPAAWEAFCGGRKDVGLFSFTVDLPEGCSAAEFRVVTHGVLRRRYESLARLVPGCLVRGPWLRLTELDPGAPLFATEATLKVRRGAGLASRAVPTPAIGPAELAAPESFPRLSDAGPRARAALSV